MLKHCQIISNTSMEAVKDTSVWNGKWKYGMLKQEKYEPPYEKTRFDLAKTKAQISFAVTAKLISAFVFSTQIVQFLFFLNPKFQTSIHHL